MTVLVQLNDIHLAFPDKIVLGGVSLAVHHGERMALVGENGVGKTCLLRIMLGRLIADSGQVLTPSGTRIGYLEQTGIDVGPNDLATCLDVALEPFRELRALEARIETISGALARAVASEETNPLLEALGDAQHRFEEGGGYTYGPRTQETLSGLGLPERVWSAPVQRLSAGQKVRLALVRLLLDEYDLLLLDEPTNHLDLHARVWLEAYLARLKTAYVVASHDRRFLDAVATRVAHLDRGALTVYSGNYTAFRAQAAQHLDTAWKIYDKRQRLVRKLQTQARSYRDWANAKEKQKRGAADKGYIGHRAAKLMKRSLVAQRRLEATIERMQTEKPRRHDPVAIAFSATEGHQLLWARDLNVGFEPRAPLARGITVNIGMGDRLAVLGPNGSGKTTVLRTFLGEVPPLAGQVRLVPSARAGYFDQETRQIPLTDTALRVVLDAGGDETLVRTVMGRMCIRRESVHKPVGSLSAGERAKVLLTRLILGGHNLLILDEPTNFLDVDTQDVLLEALRTFPGGVVFVSHDRHFIDTLATQALELGGEP
ncbi:MAG: ribosomal protection-like ABC-F family protein [Armatimonadota bacterium]